MNPALAVFIAMLTLFGFYSALREIRAILMKFAKKKEQLCEKTAQPFDKDA